MPKGMNKLPPVAREVVRRRITELIRLGEPFALSQVPDERVREVFAMLTDDELVGNTDRQMTLTLTIHNELKSTRFRDKVYRRWTRGQKLPYRLHGSTVVYPSNDREKYHLKDNEVFLRWKYGWRDAEPPIRYETLPERVEPLAVTLDESPRVEDSSIRVSVGNEGLSIHELVAMNRLLIGSLRKLVKALGAATAAIEVLADEQSADE